MRKPLSLLVVLFLFLLAGAILRLPVNASALPDTTTPPAENSTRTPVSAEEGEAIARAHLLNNAALYKVDRADLTGLRVDTNYADATTGARYVKFVQTHNGIEVHNAVVNVTILPDGSVLYVGNRAVAKLADSANSASPALSHSDAINAAAAALNLDYTAATVTRQESVGGTEREIRYAGGDLSLESIPVKLAYQPVADGSLRLAWDLNIYQHDAMHWWDLRVDALTGDLLDKTDWVVSENWDALLNDPNQVSTGAVPGKLETITTFADTLVTPHAPTLVGSYRVYALPIESPNHGGRTLVANPDLPSASPHGWHDTNGAAGAEFTTTQGNNAHAYTDVDGNNSPDAGSSPDGGAGLVFDFPIDLTQEPNTYRPAAVTNLFYWNNLMHDIPHLYGFDEAARNFQENNYGNGGLGSDYVNAEAQDGSGINNANFATPPDGLNPRMQMFLWNLTSPQRDGDLDNGIIAHEYGHGISNRLTGTGAGCLANAEQMGEGWSDWQAVLLTMRASDTATTNRGVGTYVLDQPINGPGIRPAPYNTNFAVNNFTYSDLPSMAVPHGVGFVWNTMLWEMNWELINVYGFNPDIYDTTPYTGGGNILAYKLVQDGMAIQPCLPGFVDGRNAILAADVALTGGDNECTIWTAFARRGLGFSASQGLSSSTTDGTAAFDLPPQCTGGPTFTPTPSPSPTATLPGGAQTVTYCSTFAPIAIPDAGTPIDGSLTIPDANPILDVNLQISATHSWVGDLTFTLNNGAANTTVINRPGVPSSTFGCNSDNIAGTFVDDEGTDGAWETTCLAGPPAFPAGGRLVGGDPASTNLMTIFDGFSTAGTWTVSASDGAGGDTGVFDGFCLEFVIPGSATSTPTVTPSATTELPTNTPTPTATQESSTPTATPTVTRTPTTTGGLSKLYLPLVIRD